MYNEGSLLSHEGERTATESDEAGSANQIDIRAQIAPRITFATHQCDVPLVADLVVTNLLDRDLENLTLHLFADPKVVSDRVWTIDRIAAQSEFRPLDRRISIAGGMLEALTERMRSEIRIELRQGDTVLAETSHPMIALARNEWGGAEFMPELLAAFVTPNDPSVQVILKKASEILEASGKISSLEGYQARSRKRSWEIASGIWAAVSRRGITYAEPPAGFERQGQKIRLPSMIDEQGMATCLDTALLFAAAIEQSGLYPLVVLTKNHALAGVWLQPQSLPTLTVEDPLEIRKAIAQDELVLFETTLATGGRAISFSKAIEEGKRRVSEAHDDDFVYAIDIRQARGRDIQPLASTVTGKTSTQVWKFPKLRSTRRRICPLSNQEKSSTTPRRHQPRGWIDGNAACSISLSVIVSSISSRRRPRFRSSVPTLRSSKTRSPRAIASVLQRRLSAKAPPENLTLHSTI